MMNCYCCVLLRSAAVLTDSILRRATLATITFCTIGAVFELPGGGGLGG